MWLFYTQDVIQEFTKCNVETVPKDCFEREFLMTGNVSICISNFGPNNVLDINLGDSASMGVVCFLGLE